MTDLATLTDLLIARQDLSTEDAGAAAAEPWALPTCASVVKLSEKSSENARKGLANFVLSM